MDKQKSSLGFNGYKRVDGYFQNHCQELTTANKDVYDSVDKFRANFTHFEFALSELTDEQKLDAWLQLYNKAVRVVKKNEDELNKKLALEKPIKKEKFKINFIHVMMFSLIAAFCIGFGIYNSRNYKPSNDYSPKQNNVSVVSNSIPSSFDECRSKIQSALSSVSGTSYKTSIIIDTNTAYMARICTNDGSVLLTCSASDGKMVTTQSSDCPL